MKQSPYTSNQVQKDSCSLVHSSHLLYYSVPAFMLGNILRALLNKTFNMLSHT